MSNETNNLGHFLTYELWCNALNLLDFQVKAQDSNKHFKTLSMIYYKELNNEIPVLKTDEFYKLTIANNLFYGLENQFAVIPYVEPKIGLGLRNYKFLTYPMRALYDSIGLYLLKLSSEFLNNFYIPIQSIRSYYGGGIYFEKENLVVTKNNIYFSEYYKRFRNGLRKEIGVKKDIQETLENNKNTVIIRIDIQNYYDEISIPTLLNLLDENIKDSQKSILNFDEVTKEQISFFLRYIYQMESVVSLNLTTV